MLTLVLFVLVCLTHGIVGDKPSPFANPGLQGGYGAPLPVLQQAYHAPAPAPLPVPQGGYSAPSHGGFSVGVDDSGEAFISGGGGGFGGGFGGGHSKGVGRGCGPNEVLHVDGSCVVPHVTRNVFVYAAPKLPVSYLPRPALPKPRIDYNVVFVRTPEHPGGLEPIVIPPPQQKTLVYVLTKNGQIGQQVIEVPAGPLDRPEVFYINYNEGDNPSLPGGLTLQDGLAAAVPHNGKLIGGGGGGGFGGGFNGGFGGGHGGGQKGGFGGGHGGGHGGGLKGGFGGDSFEGGLGGGYSAPPVPAAPSNSY